MRGALAFPQCCEATRCEPTDNRGDCPRLGRGPGDSYGRTALAAR
jgi:hypothetical protein